MQAAQPLPGLEHAARFGHTRALEKGWRPWLAHWLGRDDLASTAPAAVASATLNEPPTPQTVLRGDSPPTGFTSTAVASATFNEPPTPQTVHRGDSPPTGFTSTAVASATLNEPLTPQTVPRGDSPPTGFTSTGIASATTPAAMSTAHPRAPTSTASAARPPANTPLSPSATAWLATPVHLIAGLTSLHLDRRSLLTLPLEDLQALAQDFNHTFGTDSELHLKAIGSGQLLMYGPGTLAATTTEPARALVNDLEASLPHGSGASSLKRLGAELEMWLHAHPLNEARSRRGELPISTLWLWGGGPHLSGAAHAITTAPQVTITAAASLPNAASPPDTHNTVRPPGPCSLQGPSSLQGARPTDSPHPTALAFGSDPYLLGLWHLHGAQSLPLPTQLSDLFSHSPDNRPTTQRAALVVELTPLLHTNPRWTVFEALAEIDRRFLTPALAALQQGKVANVVVIANDRKLHVRRRDRLKFWRRPQPGLTGLQA